MQRNATNDFILPLVEIAAVYADQGKSLLRYAMTKIRLRITVSTLYMFINHHTSYPDELLMLYWFKVGEQ